MLDKLLAQVEGGPSPYQGKVIIVIAVLPYKV